MPFSDSLKTMNVSCYEYLINRRIMYAEQLLIEPGLTISQVAMKSGFNSLATLIEYLKKIIALPKNIEHYMRLMAIGNLFRNG